MRKKILTIDDLVTFCNQQKLQTFNAKESGYPISVLVPSTFSVEEDDDLAHKGLMKIKVKILHTLRNRNGSYVSKESAEKAMHSIVGRPLLAHIHEVNGEYEFSAHDVEVDEDEDGNQVIKYVEQQVGSFPTDDAWFEGGEDGKEFLCAYAVIPVEYTKTAEIIKRKGGTKVSSELCIESMSFNADEGYLDLLEWYISGVTLLGKDEDGNEIQEGMKGARADIVDFSAKNNSVTTEYNADAKLVEVLEKLNTTLSNFNINNSGLTTQEGGNTVKFDELLSKYNVTVEDITFDYEGLSDEELEAKFAEVFGEDTSSGTTNEPEVGEPEVSEPEQFSVSVSMGNQTFALSLSEIDSAIWQLVNATYGNETDWYGCDVFEDNTVVMHNYYDGKHYRQNFVKDENNNFALEGERVEVFGEFLTAEERIALTALRTNYDSVLNELNQYKAAENEAKKNALMSDASYASITNTEEYQAIQSDTEKFSAMSAEDLEKDLDAIVLKYAKSGKLEFAEKNDPDGVGFKGLPFSTKTKKRSKYGNFV